MWRRTIEETMFPIIVKLIRLEIGFLALLG
jgi:hypothetical protein